MNPPDQTPETLTETVTDVVSEDLAAERAVMDLSEVLPEEPSLGATPDHDTFLIAVKTHEGRMYVQILHEHVQGERPVAIDLEKARHINLTDYSNRQGRRRMTQAIARLIMGQVGK